ncbi:MAG: DNA polymerase III subunit alpha, partial [Erysipelotrichia bacterium]|nr:DNA polymerase III subunit alpha [Erysipelotrichia bacterium]
MVTHLHVRSAYTLLNSTLRINDIIAYAKQYGCQQVALVDKNVMHGAMAFYHGCQKAKIKAIYGLEICCIHHEKEYGFIAYAKDDIGYHSLLKLSSYINTSQEKLTLEHFLQFDSHLIVTTAGSNDHLQSLLLNDDETEITYFIETCKKSFEDFYVAIAMNDSGLLKIKNELLVNICDTLQVKTFALSRIYYGSSEDEEAFKVLCAIDQQKTLNDPTLHFSSKRYFRSEQEMQALYSEQQLANAEEIANKCNVTMQLKKVSLPVFKNKYGVDSKTYLRSLCRKGLEKRLNHQVLDVYIKRLNYELEIILKMGYADYFLIVYDFIRYAKTQSIYVGPGRGSAAGSLVSYCLGITHVDPIKYDLLFERFLNPERISMPDIDIDFPDDRRDEVIAYVKKLYGEQHVAHIVTFGTLGAKQVLRDVARAMNISIREVDMITKMIPNTPKITLRAVYESSGKFKQMILASKQYSALFAMGEKLEGLPRHASTHAAGIVLSDRSISDVCPIIKVEDDVYSTQYT